MGMTEKQWLAAETAETRRLFGLVITNYDDGRLTLADAKHQAAVIIEATLSRVYDKGFTAGINAADLDGDSVEEGEIDFDFRGEDEEGEEHP